MRANSRKRVRGPTRLNSSYVPGWTFLWPTLLYAVNAVTSLSALSGMTLPMYTAIKRCAPLATLALGVLVLRKPMPSIKIIASVVLITLGCVLAGLGDLEFNPAAYWCGAVSVAAQSLYLTLVQRGAENRMTTLTVLQLNSYNTLPLFSLAFVFSSEAHGLPAYFTTEKLTFWACLFLQICMGSILNYSLFLCTMLNSALTTSLVGVFKAVVQTAVGFFAFGGVAFHPLNIAGLCLNTYGGILYTFSRYRESKSKKSGDLASTQMAIVKPSVPLMSRLRNFILSFLLPLARFQQAKASNEAPKYNFK
ncbi:SLC35D3 [Cordylochernes scorpioides]|uniref:SLC35D3 n=1 Tax=Cordylochernes scorpioides TaxID=51811 RepID=A0ABY6KLN4_9ARAC|nr:SLC35D3 [Cordylochernes scorpioides]